MKVENNKYYDLIFGNYGQILFGLWELLIMLKMCHILPPSFKVERKTHLKILNRLHGIRMTYGNKIYSLSKKQKYQKEIGS